MPFIRVTCPKNAFTAEQKEKLAERIVYEAVKQEVDPVTESSKATSRLVFNEIDEHNCFPGGVSLVQHPERVFWIVEVIPPAGLWNQSRRDALHSVVARVFVDVLGDDGSVFEQDGMRVSPAYLLQLYTLVVEIPEGNWGGGGQTLEAGIIGKIMGATTERLAEIQENAARLKAARVL
jgi:phenylpyruvate tautomerase PptA (4-oxalocrotonate tautomerase family)